MTDRASDPPVREPGTNEAPTAVVIPFRRRPATPKPDPAGPPSAA